jgi:hypothetical protein
MSRLVISLLFAITVGWHALPAEAADLRNYSVADLLQPCEEGDNDARWGADLEANCEQFINGFTAAYILLTDGAEAQDICLPPPGNRSDEVRWAFIEWTYKNYDRRDVPAAQGLLEAMKAHFPCE